MGRRTNHSSYSKTGMIDLSCIIIIWALVRPTSVFHIIDAFDRRTDRRWGGVSVKFSELIMPRTALIRCHNYKVVVFQNELTGVENRGQIFHFSPLIKISGGVNGISYLKF